jgi:hypothetical protein
MYAVATTWSPKTSPHVIQIERIKLSAATACRSHARARPLESSPQLAKAGTAAAPPRSAAQKWNARSPPGRLITETRPAGELYFGTSGEI